MLTDSQYRALKAWNDSISLVLAKITRTSNGHILCARVKQKTVVLADSETTETLLALPYIKPVKKKGLIYRYRKAQPACNEAIREYEEAHDKEMKE